MHLVKAINLRHYLILFLCRLHFQLLRKTLSLWQYTSATFLSKLIVSDEIPILLPTANKSACPWKYYHCDSLLPTSFLVPYALLPHLLWRMLLILPTADTAKNKWLT
jgi:hypothetical protein